MLLLIPNLVLTISVFAEVLWCWFSWQALARLVDRPDSELVDLLLLQTLDLGLADGLLRGEHFDEVQVIFSLLFHQVVGDWATSICERQLPD